MTVQWALLDFFHRIAVGFCSVLALLAVMGIGLRRRTLRTVRPRRR
jgi:hypothetical protein